RLDRDRGRRVGGTRTRVRAVPGESRGAPRSDRLAPLRVASRGCTLPSPMSARAHVRALLARVLPAGIFLASCSELPGADPVPSGPSQAPVPPAAFQDLHWRLAGPLRGGWATTARGVPGRPEEFWFGAADGGVWRTTD